MPSLSLDDAIDKALTTGQLSGIRNSLRLELRDFFAHEVMKFCGGLKTEQEQQAVHDFFKHVFKGISAFPERVRR